MELFFLLVLVVLMITALGSGFPVAFALPGAAVISVGLAAATGMIFTGNPDAYFHTGGPYQWLSAGVTNLRGVYWDVERDTLIAIPLFIFMGIMLSSIFLLIVGKLGIRVFARISDVPNSFLYPVVLVLCVFGTYAVGNTMFDILIMIIMGLVGYFMLRFRIPAAPFLIAFILGPLLEDSFRQALQLSRGDFSIFIRNPICWFFIALTVLSIAFIIRRNLKNPELAKALSD